MSAVVIGMDPHKRSATIEVMGSDEAVLAGAAIMDCTATAARSAAI